MEFKTIWVKLPLKEGNGIDFRTVFRAQTWKHKLWGKLSFVFLICRWNNCSLEAERRLGGELRLKMWILSMQSLWITSLGPQKSSPREKQIFLTRDAPAFRGRAIELSGYSPVSLGSRLQESCHQLFLQAKSNWLQHNSKSLQMWL